MKLEDYGEFGNSYSLIIVCISSKLEGIWIINLELLNKTFTWIHNQRNV